MERGGEILIKFNKIKMFETLCSVWYWYGIWSPELIQGPGVLPNRGYKSIYKRYTKIGL
jgi:hypothetical protein